jgi:DNA-directed RNA polymerase I and III subunit RPAC1
VKVRCKRNPNAPENSKNPDELYIDSNVYTKHMKWIPKPGQQEMFKGGIFKSLAMT